MSGRRSPDVRRIGGFDVVGSGAVELIELLRERRDAGTPTELLFANTNFVMTCRPLAAALHGPETLIVNDGIGLELASRFFHRRPFPENLNGTDFVPRLLRSLDRPTRVFLLGARPFAVDRAATVFGGLDRVEIVGAIDGFDGMANDAAVTAAIAAAAPDLLLVALGDPRQARWIVEHRGRHDVPLVIGVGALFDFVSGTIARAPHWVRRLRLEWVYRLVHEPRRLAKRYSVDLVAFFAHCATTHRHERLRDGRRGAA